MAKYDAEQLSRWKTSVLLENFDDFTKLPGDDWLSVGIPYLMAEYLSSGKQINPLYGPVAKVSALAVNPSYIVQGMFQHVDKKLRIFVKLLKGAELVKQWQFDINYPQNNEFFDTLSKASLEIMKTAGPPYDRDIFHSIKTETQSVPAYENYIRGLIVYYSFEPERMEIAKTWFDESKKADIHYQKAYQGSTDMYTFLALYNKQMKKPYSSYLTKAQEEITKMKKFAIRPDVPKRPKRYIVKEDLEYERPTNRFLVGNSYFVAGLNAAGQKRWLEAAENFERAVTNVPEDAITWLYLSQMREKTGEKNKAAEARAKTLEINKCLE